MTKLDYQRSQPKRPAASSSGRTDSREIVIPLVLLIAGLVLWGLWGLSSLGGTRSSLIIMGLILVVSAIETALGIAAAYITATVIGASFGELRTAVLKLAGIIVFCGGVSALVPFGGLLSIFIYIGLLMWIFELEKFQAIIFAVIFWAVRFAITLGVVAMLR